MCTGLEPFLISALPGIAATAAGSLVNARIQNNAIREQNRQNQIAMDRQTAATEAERGRQLAMERDQAGIIQRALAAVDPGATAARIEAQAPASEIAQAADTYNLATLPGQMTSGASAEAIGKIVGDAVQRARGILGAQSVLSSQGTSALGRQDALTSMGSRVNTIGSNRAASAGVGRLETQIPAATVTPSDSILGDALLMLGQGLSGHIGQNVGMGRAGTVFGSSLGRGGNYAG